MARSSYELEIKMKRFNSNWLLTFVCFRITNNVFMHYEIIQATMLADLHSFKLVMIFPSKTMNLLCAGWLCYPHLYFTILLFILRLKKIIFGLMFYKDVT
jgi:hypothetical protein